MTYLELTCCKCGNKIILSENDFDSADFKCSICGAQVPNRFHQDLIRSLGLISDANRELDKDYREIKTDKFEVRILLNQD